MRTALVEVGHWHASRYLRSLQLAGAQIVGVSDRMPGVAERFAIEAGCPAFLDHKEMLTASRPDFVIALGRHVEMPQIAADILDTNIPFAMEKPIGVNADQLAAIAERANRQGAFVAVPFVNRYSKLWPTLWRLENEGRMGLRAHAHFRIINGPPDRYIDDGVAWVLDPEVSGGGALRVLGIHAVDAFLHFCGHEEVEVMAAAITFRTHGTQVEDMAAALLRSKSGIIGTIEAGYSFASKTGSDFEMRVATGNSYLIDRGDRLTVATLDDGKVETLPLEDQNARYDRFAKDTLACLQAGRPPIATIRDCYRAMCVIDEIYRKAARITAAQ